MRPAAGGCAIRPAWGSPLKTLPAGSAASFAKRRGGSPGAVQADGNRQYRNPKFQLHGGQRQAVLVENGERIPVEVPATTEKRIRGMIGLRRTDPNLIQLQLHGGTDENIKAAQEKLNQAYDVYTAEYALLNSTETSGPLNRIHPTACCVPWT